MRREVAPVRELSRAHATLVALISMYYGMPPQVSLSIEPLTALIAPVILLVSVRREVVVQVNLTPEHLVATFANEQHGGVHAALVLVQARIGLEHVPALRALLGALLLVYQDMIIEQARAIEPPRALQTLVLGLTHVDVALVTVALTGDTEQFEAHVTLERFLPRVGHPVSIKVVPLLENAMADLTGEQRDGGEVVNEMFTLFFYFFFQSFHVVKCYHVPF